MKKYVIFFFILVANLTLSLTGMEQVEQSTTSQEANKQLLSSILTNELTPEKLDQLISNGANINLRAAGGQTPLYVAVNSQNENAVKALLDAGADPTIATNLSVTPLTAAQSSGNKNITKLVREKLPAGPEQNIRFEPFSRSTPRESLIRNKAVDAEREIFKLLYQNELTSKELVKLLEQGDSKRKASINARNSRGQTPLHIAVEQDNPSAVTLLLKFEADVNAPDNDGITPMQVAQKLGRKDIVQLLSGHQPTKATPSSKSEDADAAPLFTAIKNQKITPEQLKNFLLTGIDINARNSEGKTPLHLAVEQDNPFMINLFLEQGADIHAVDNNGNTPLHLAMIRHNPGTIQQLLNAGALEDTFQENDQGATPLSIAQLLADIPGQERILEILLQPFLQELGMQSIDELTKMSKEGRKLRIESLLADVKGTPISGPPKVSIDPTNQQGKKPKGQRPAPELDPKTAETLKERLQEVLKQKRGTPTAGSYAQLYGAAALGGTLLAYLGYKNFYAQKTVPTNLTKYSLNILLTSALKNKDYEYAHQLALANPQAVRRLASDQITKENLKDLIDKAETDLVNETASASASVNPFAQFVRPSMSTQLKYLTDLLYTIEYS